MNSNIKISIVTITLNSVKTVEDTIHSILNQTYCDIENIIIDGGSTDGTVDLIRRYEPLFKGRLRWISEPDDGLYDAINKGIRMATGDIVGVLHSDDFYHKNNSIELVAETFKDKQVEAVFSDLRIVSPHNLNKTIRYYSSARFNISRFRYGFMPAHPTFFTYKKYFELFGYYSTDYSIAADYELLVRFLYINKLKYKYIPTDLLKMRYGGRSTASILKKLKFDSEIVRACRSNKLYTNSIIIIFRGLEKLFEFIITKKKQARNLNNANAIITKKSFT
jgi:glycosyltransferase involved in cell wall biosynthesis